MSIEIHGPDPNEGRRRLAELERGKLMRGLNAAVGKRVEVELRRYFASRPSNKRGWRSSGFWRRRIRNATALTHYDEDGATITIADPAMNQKVYGGMIRPREGKFLTIPARPEAAGRSPRTFSNLAFIPLKDFAQGRGAGKLVGLLVEKREGGGFTRTRGRSRSGGRTRLKVMFYCVAAVFQAPDRDALPPADVIERAMEHETHRYMQRAITAAGGGR